MDSIFGLSEKALRLTEDRSVLLTNNIANSSTPHYKARDIDFHQTLQETNSITPNLLTTHANHIKPSSEQDSGAHTMYRVPMQMSLDGNTVDEEIERKNFIENALNYQVNLTFIKNKTDELRKAIKGE